MPTLAVRGNRLLAAIVTPPQTLIATSEPLLAIPDLITPVETALLNFTKSLHFVYPLSFHSGDQDWPVYCGGTCFAVTDGCDLFIVTARHCNKGRLGDPVVLGPGKSRFPLRQHVYLGTEQSDLDWEDIACFTTYRIEQWPKMSPVDAIDLNQLMNREVFAENRSILVVVGFPDSETEIIQPTIIRKQTLLLGKFGGRTSDQHCYYFSITSPARVVPNGLSGSPVLKVERQPDGEFSSTLMGMVIRGGEGSPVLRFIGVDVVIRMLLAIRRGAK